MNTKKILDTECQLYISCAQFVCVSLTPCKMPAMTMSCALTHLSTLGGKNSCTLLLATVKFACLSYVVDFTLLPKHL